MDFNFITYRSILIIVHLIGLALGVGGAFTGDAIFFHSIRDQVISKTELGFLKLSSKLVWLGLATLIISGALIFSTSPAAYLQSPRFLSKMTIVAIITINGLTFHFIHIKWFERIQDQKFSSVGDFLSRRSWILASGAISSLSWISALILGSLSHVPWPYYQIIGLYLLALTGAITTSLLLRNLILPAKTS